MWNMEIKQGKSLGLDEKLQKTWKMVANIIGSRTNSS